MGRTILSMMLMGAIMLFSCQKKQPPPTPPTPVNLYQVKAAKVFYYDKYPSTTQALSQVNIYPQVQGYITGVYFKEGSHVKKGQVLYDIDKTLYQASVSQAEANLKVAHGTTVQAQEDQNRYEYLNKYKAVAKQLYDHAVITLQNSQNAEQAANQAVKTAKTNLAFSTIRAPFDGTIGFSQVKLGNMVTVGQTILNTISTDDPMAVDFLINEKQLPAFEQLTKGPQDPHDSLFTILLPDNSLYPYPGKLANIDRAVDQQTGAIRIRLVFPNPGFALRVGMSCVVRMHNQEKTPQLLIPYRAVVEQMGEYFVFVAKDTMVAAHTGDASKKEEAKDKGKEALVPGKIVLEKKVVLGQVIGADVIVKEGINEGDRIVVDGIQQLHDGSRIATGKPAADSSGGNRENAAAAGNKKD